MEKELIPQIAKVVTTIHFTDGTFQKFTTAPKSKRSTGEKELSETAKAWLEAASRWWHALESAKILPVRHQNMNENQKAKEINKWAAVLDKVERLDKIPREEIISVLEWLLKVNTFWIHGGPLQGLSALRKESTNGSRKIDTIYGQYKKWKGGTKSTVVNKPKHGDKFTEFEAKKIREAYPKLASNFKRFPIDDAEREFIYLDDQAG